MLICSIVINIFSRSFDPDSGVGNMFILLPLTRFIFSLLQTIYNILLNPMHNITTSPILSDTARRTPTFTCSTTAITISNLNTNPPPWIDGKRLAVPGYISNLFSRHHNFMELTSMYCLASFIMNNMPQLSAAVDLPSTNLLALEMSHTD